MSKIKTKGQCPDIYDFSRLYDISVPIGTKIPQWPNTENQFDHHYKKSLASGDGANVSWVGMNVHFGTHVDAPYHHLMEGERIHNISVENLIGPALVIDLTHIRDTILLKDIQALDKQDSSICLLKTRNSELWSKPDFEPDFVHLSKEATTFLISRKFSVIGIDYLSIESYHSKRKEIHKELFRSGTIVVEGLDLSRVAAGKYFFICLPLNIVNAEAAPARAILFGR